MTDSVTARWFPANLGEYEHRFTQNSTDMTIPDMPSGSVWLMPYLERNFYQKRNWYLWTFGEAWFVRQVERFLFTNQHHKHPRPDIAHFNPEVQRIAMEMGVFQQYLANPDNKEDIPNAIQEEQ